MHTNRLEYTITSVQIQIVAGERRLPAFFAYPNSGGLHPGVVLLDATPDSTARRQVANRLAQRGLYALAPALDDLPATAAAAAARAALQVLRTHNHCNGSLTVIGLDPAGSGLALQTGQASGQLAAVAAFAPPPALAEDTLRASPPLLLVFGGPATPALHRLQAGFAPTPGRLLLRYPRAGSAFFTQPRTTTDRRCAEYAWTHLLAFLEQHLDWSRPARPAVM